MTVTLELRPEVEQGLLSQARQRGVSLDDYLKDVLSSLASVTSLPGENKQPRPLKTGRGLFAKYGPAPSAEEIDENRHEMFGGFAQDF